MPWGKPDEQDHPFISIRLTNCPTVSGTILKETIEIPQEVSGKPLEDQKKLPGMIRAGIHMLSKWRAKVIKDSNEEGGDE